MGRANRMNPTGPLCKELAEKFEKLGKPEKLEKHEKLLLNTSEDKSFIRLIAYHEDHRHIVIGRTASSVASSNFSFHWI